jgi:hypothetical protein
VATVLADNRAQDCEVVIAWARMALVLRPDPTDPANFLPPANCLGPVQAHLPAVAADGALQHNRWTVLARDLPALDPQRLSQSDQVLAVLAAIERRSAQRMLPQRLRLSSPSSRPRRFP